MSGVLHEFKGKRILVVEARDGVACGLREQLSMQGATVVGSMLSTGATVALIEIGRIDAAILDVTLDASTAFFLAETLEEHKIPFLFVTAPPSAGGRGRYAGYELGKPGSLEIIGKALFGPKSH